MGKPAARLRLNRNKEFPVTHRVHHYGTLMQRWAAFAKEAGFRWRRFVTVDGHAIYFLDSGRQKQSEEAIYISAGMHGDEPAPPWALLEWAQENLKLLQARPFIFFPCLNPHGLIMNTRLDQRGVDLNRSFNHPDDPLIAAWMKVMAGRKPSIGICLHEDYDAQGCYVYELTQLPSAAQAIMKDVAKVLPIDTRRSIEGRKAKEGSIVIVRRTPPDLPGHPEAFVLHLMGARHTFTFETPSEFSLIDRIAAQKQFISATLRYGMGL